MFPATSGHQTGELHEKDGGATHQRDSCFERGFEKGKRESQIGHRKDEQEREQYVEEKLAEQESKMRVQCTMNFMFMHIIIIVCYCVN